MVGKATAFVCHGQLWLIKQSVLSVIDIYGNRLCLPWTVLVGRATDLMACYC